MIEDEPKENENLDESLYTEAELALFKLIIEELVQFLLVCFMLLS